MEHRRLKTISHHRRRGLAKRLTNALRLTVRGTLIMPPTITELEVTSDPGIDETYGIGHTARSPSDSASKSR